MGRKDQIRVGKDLQDHQTQPPSGLKVHPRALLTRIHQTNPRHLPEAAGRSRGASGPSRRGFPLWKMRKQPRGAEPSPGRVGGHRGGCQALPAMQKPREPGRVTHARGTGSMYRDRSLPQPQRQGWAGCWEKNHSFGCTEGLFLLFPIVLANATV